VRADYKKPIKVLLTKEGVRVHKMLQVRLKRFLHEQKENNEMRVALCCVVFPSRVSAFSSPPTPTLLLY
jgi:hypothetical protein